MRLGKSIVQGAHASIMSAMDALCSEDDYNYNKLEKWFIEGMKKICVRVDSKDELLAIAQKAGDANLEFHIITDAGLTEFHDMPTQTCLVIGPDEDEDIDKITGHLKLL